MFKFLKYLLILLMAVSAGIVIFFYVSGDSAVTVPLIINWAIILLVAAALAAVVLPFFFSSGKGGKKTLLSVGIVVALCVVSYLCASDVVPTALAEKTTPTTMKLTDAGLILTFILVALAILSIIGGSIVNMVKNK